MKKLIIILFFLTSAIANCSIFDYFIDLSVRPGTYYNSKNMKGTYLEFGFENSRYSNDNSFWMIDRLNLGNVLVYNDFNVTRVGFTLLSFDEGRNNLLDDLWLNMAALKLLSSEITDVSREHIFFDVNLFMNLLDFSRKSYKHQHINLLIGPTISYKHTDYNSSFLNKYVKGFEIGLESINKLKYNRFEFIAGAEYTNMMNVSELFFHNKVNINAGIIYTADIWFIPSLDGDAKMYFRKLYFTLRYDKNFLIDEKINYDKINFEINIQLMRYLREAFN